jgi:4'-phosphopantetheinyl transferase
MAAREPWAVPSVAPALGDDEVHVWFAWSPIVLSSALCGILTPEERRRADRFHLEQHRASYITARGVLRVILGGYLQIHPGRLRLVAGLYGKPRLGWPAETGLTFNVSHTNGLMLIAVGRRREVGVDVERIRDDVAYLEIAAWCCSATERAALRALPDNERREAFFTCWTRKEAYLKATGDGLTAPLDRFGVSLRPDEAAMLLDLSGRPLASDWSLRALTPGPGYVAAVAGWGRDWRLETWRWPAGAPAGRDVAE